MYFGIGLPFLGVPGTYPVVKHGVNHYGRYVSWQIETQVVDGTSIVESLFRGEIRTFHQISICLFIYVLACCFNIYIIYVSTRSHINCGPLSENIYIYI